MGVIRKDIQALRAIAVAGVLAAHAGVPLLQGGFSGVDIFFVISGYLITDHLLTTPPTSLHVIVNFWARRIKRLLPAALLVIVTTLIATKLIARVLFEQTAWDSIAATMYALNWKLAYDSVDYFASGNPASPLQHYWSLGVEEQFYFVWPLVLCAGFFLSRRSRSSPINGVPSAVWATVSLVFVVSLFFSIWFTVREPSAAYFVTPTRMWELALGGLVSLTSRSGALKRLPAAQIITAGGVVGIVASYLLFSEKVSYPGAAALLPTMSTAFVIIGASPSFSRAVGLRWIQWMGNHSYAIYLWHFPLLVLMPYVLRRAPTPLDLGCAILGTLALAGVTKKFVEDPVRFGVKSLDGWRVFASTGAAMCFVSVSAFGLIVQQDRNASGNIQGRIERLVEAAQDSGSCAGATALQNAWRCRGDTLKTLVTPPEFARKDWFPSSPPPGVIGDGTAGFLKIALVGNSHMKQYIPALVRLGNERPLALEMFDTGDCPILDIGALNDAGDAAELRQCVSTVESAIRNIALKSFDLVLVSTLTAKIDSDKGTFWPNRWIQPAASVLKRMSLNAHVVVIRDNPNTFSTSKDSIDQNSGIRVPDCIELRKDPINACDGSRSRWLKPDLNVVAARSLASSRVGVVDMTDYFCNASTCPVTMGGVIVYTDQSHLTKTFMETLTPYFKRELEKIFPNWF
jgi:peptidoglycan/LPS O-acetylase OafA/YrhL